jgi:hypothetical protein
MKPELPRQFFEKYTSIKFHENPSSGSQVTICGKKDRRTDRHDEANSRFSHLKSMGLERLQVEEKQGKTLCAPDL